MFSITCFAQEMDPNILIKGLQENHLNTEPKECHELDKDKALVHKCVESICGKANPERSIFLTGEKLQSLISNDIEAEFEKDLPQIKSSIKTSIRYTKELIDELKKREKKLDFSDKESGQLILKSLLPHLDITLEDSSGKISIDHDEYSKFSKKEKLFFDKFKNEIKSNINNDWELAYELGLPISASTIIKETSLLIEKLGNIENKENSTEQTLQGLNWVKASASQKDVPPKLLHTYASYLFGMKSSVQEKLDMKPKTNLCEVLDCKKFYKTHVSPEVSKNIIALEKSLKKMESTGIDALANKCKSPYYFDKVEKEFIPKFLFENDAKKRVVAYVEKNFSKETSEQFKGYINYALQIKFEEKNVFNQNYVDLMKQVSEQEETLKNKKIGKLPEQSNYKLVSSLNKQIFYGVGLVTQLQLQCKSDMTNSMVMIDDHYNPVFNSMKISHHTCNQKGTTGKDIFAHELGHVFSALVANETSSKESKDDFLNTRTCVSSQYLIPTHNGMRVKQHSSDHFRSEEDMADHFSAMVANLDFEKTKESSIAMCALLPVSGSSYGDIPTENLPYDNHTVTFLRVLREAHYKGLELSDSCQEIADKNKHLWKFKNCDDSNAGIGK